MLMKYSYSPLQVFDELKKPHKTTRYWINWENLQVSFMLQIGCYCDRLDDHEEIYSSKIPR